MLCQISFGLFDHFNANIDPMYFSHHLRSPLGNPASTYPYLENSGFVCDVWSNILLHDLLERRLVAPLLPEYDPILQLLMTHIAEHPLNMVLVSGPLAGIAIP